MLFGLFLTLGVAVLSVALRSFQTSFSQKAGALGFLIASFLAVYFITGSWRLGLSAAAELAFSALAGNSHPHPRFAAAERKTLRPKSPPSQTSFPTLDEITREIENEGFVHVNDAGWDWEDYRQFFRLFYKEEDRAQATHLPERTTRSFLLLPANFLAREERHRSGRLGIIRSPTA